MKYFNVQLINYCISQIREGPSTREHVTSRAVLNMSRHYFPVDKFSITAEQSQTFTNKRPDFVIEKFNTLSGFFDIHCYIEVKSLVNSNITNILDQLCSSIFAAMDDMGNLTGSFSTFVIAVKGTKIAFYMYHSFVTLLEEYGIQNYKGFVPLNYKIPIDVFMQATDDKAKNISLYQKYTRNMNFETDSVILSRLNALPIKDKLDDNPPTRLIHPHILDLDRLDHREHIHGMWQYIVEGTANIIP